MKTNRLAISKFQLFFLIVQTQIGIGILSLPSDIQSTTDGDGWISTLLAGAAVQILLLVYWTLYRRYPNRTLSEITVILFGKFLGKAYNVLFSVSCIVIAGLISALYVQLINTWLLPLTPKWMLLILIIVVCLFLTLEELRIISRFFVVSSSLIVLLILMSLLNLANEMHFSYLLPIGKTGPLNIVLGSHQTFFSMLGFEIVLFAFSYVNSNSKGLLKVVSSANLFVTILYTYYVLICLISFSPGSLKQVKAPLLFMFKGLSYQVIERIDLIFLSIWIIPMTTSIIAYLYLAGKSLASRRDSYGKAIFACGVAIFAAGYYLSTLENMDFVSRWIQNAHLLVIGVVPTLMLIISFLFNKQDKGCTS